MGASGIEIAVMVKILRNYECVGTLVILHFRVLVLDYFNNLWWDFFLWPYGAHTSLILSLSFACHLLLHIFRESQTLSLISSPSYLSQLSFSANAETLISSTPHSSELHHYQPSPLILYFPFPFHLKLSTLFFPLCSLHKNTEEKSGNSVSFPTLVRTRTTSCHFNVPFSSLHRNFGDN